jgi:hypothetical protein
MISDIKVSPPELSFLSQKDDKGRLFKPANCFLKLPVTLTVMELLCLQEMRGRLKMDQGKTAKNPDICKSRLFLKRHLLDDFLLVDHTNREYLIEPKPC